MEIRSLAYRTDLFFPRFDGIIEDKGDYIVIRTPSNPTFHWGNFLLFPAPPQPGDLERWKLLFAQEIGPPSDIHHLAFGWDTTDGETGAIEPFAAAGFIRDDSVILTAQTVHRPLHPNTEAAMRPLTEDWEWEQVLECQVLCRDDCYSETGYRDYLRPKMARYRAMAQAGFGSWFGAFLDDQLAADLGLYAMDGLGRFQSVETHPDFRRRGLCGTLVHYAAQYGQAHWDANTLVMLADEHYHAARIYQSVGFRPTERLVTVTWWEG